MEDYSIPPNERYRVKAPGRPTIEEADALSDAIIQAVITLNRVVDEAIGRGLKVKLDTLSRQSPKGEYPVLQVELSLPTGTGQRR